MPSRALDFIKELCVDDRHGHVIREPLQHTAVFFSEWRFAIHYRQRANDSARGRERRNRGAMYR